MKWTAENIVPGTIVAKQEAERFGNPMLIGFFPHSASNPTYGLIDLRDGMFMKFSDGSKELLAQQLNEHGYVVAIKIRSESDVAGPVENRMNLPAVTIYRGRS